MRKIAVTITPLQAANIIRNLTQDGVSITLKRTMTKGERQLRGWISTVNNGCCPSNCYSIRDRSIVRRGGLGYPSFNKRTVR